MCACFCVKPRFLIACKCVQLFCVFARNGDQKPYKKKHKFNIILNKNDHRSGGAVKGGCP